MAGTTKLMTAGGGGVSLTPASSIASDVTVNVPSQNCTLDIQGPAFSAYASNNQTISSGTFTKIQLNQELFDTNSCFDSTTNYRFTPNVAGYYQISAAARVTNGAAAENIIAIYKNGSILFRGCNSSLASSNTFIGTVVSGLVSLNGTTDYVEIYVYQDTGASKTLTGSAEITWATGHMARAA